MDSWNNGIMHSVSPVSISAVSGQSYRKHTSGPFLWTAVYLTTFVIIITGECVLRLCAVGLGGYDNIVSDSSRRNLFVGLPGNGYTRNVVPMGIYASSARAQVWHFNLLIYCVWGIADSLKVTAVLLIVTIGLSRIRCVSWDPLSFLL